MSPPTQTARAAMQRIHVVGTTGAGKTTLARRLAERLALPHIELDALFWEPQWTQAALPVFRARVTQALRGTHWTVDGNYSRVRDIIWARADTVVWLDYRLSLILARLLQRALRRSLGRQVLWGNNRESLGRVFFSRESILLFALQTYGRRRREYAALFAASAHARLQRVRLSSPAETRAWLTNVTIRVPEELRHNESSSGNYPP